MEGAPLELNLRNEPKTPHFGAQLLLANEVGQDLTWWWVTARPPVLGFWPCTPLAGFFPHLVWMWAKELLSAEAGELLPHLHVWYQMSEQQPGLTPARRQRVQNCFPAGEPWGAMAISCQQLKIKQTHVSYFKSLGICTPRNVSSESGCRECCKGCYNQKWGIAKIKSLCIFINPFFKALQDFGGRLSFVEQKAVVQTSHFAPLWSGFTCFKNLGDGWLEEEVQAWEGQSQVEIIWLPRGLKSLLICCHCFTWEFRPWQWGFDTRMVQETVTFLGQFNLNLAQCSLQ